MKYALAAFALITAAAPLAFADLKAQNEIMMRFDHREHEVKVFNQKSVSCSHCHNFNLNEITRELIPTPQLKNTTFTMDLKGICHECHKTSEAKWRDAPKACVTCHRSIQTMAAIAPANHRNLEWKRTHSANARADGSGCLDCHTSSQCVKCHLQRNDIELTNHTRNFRFFHSVQARLEPHRCDACHTKSYCINCHTNQR
jgi:hypothetical protein